MPLHLTPGPVLAASAFNWTPDIVRAERPTAAIAVGIVADGITDTIEIEPGQTFRGFPTSTEAELDAFREALTAEGGRVSIVGASLDDVTPRGERLTDDEREAFLVPQLRAAHRIGAEAVRLPIGQAGSVLLRRVLPLLHELDLTILEEIQGQQTPQSPATHEALDLIADLDDERLGVLVDCSMFMPALPPSYLEVMRAGGIPESLAGLLENDWRSPDTHAAVVGLLRTGGVPPLVHTLYMNLLVRFGRSDVSVIRPILPLVGAFHLKFWDLDDTDARVSAPLRDLARELGSQFSGTLCSEWGGHEWLDEADPTDMTRRHLALAREIF